MEIRYPATALRWPGAPTSPLVAAWPIELPHLQFHIHGSADGVAAVHLLKVYMLLPVRTYGLPQILVLHWYLDCSFFRLQVPEAECFVCCKDFRQERRTLHVTAGQ